MLSNAEIVQSVRKEPIGNIARGIRLIESEIETYGDDKAKISLEVADRVAKNQDGKYILVTAMTPTPLGEGKTVTTIGLSMALNRIGRKTIACIRQPSMGPVSVSKAVVQAAVMLRLYQSTILIFTSPEIHMLFHPPITF